MFSCSLGWRVTSPMMPCWQMGAVALCPAALWLVPRRCLQPWPGTLSGMLGRFASQECPAAGQAGRQGMLQGMLQARCAHGARLRIGHRWEPQGSSPRTGIAIMSMPWQARYAFIKLSGHHRTTGGRFAADRQRTAVAHLRAAGKRWPVAEGCLGGMC